LPEITSIGFGSYLRAPSEKQLLRCIGRVGTFEKPALNKRNQSLWEISYCYLKVCLILCQNSLILLEVGAHVSD